jgi:hypothetical protein
MGVRFVDLDPEVKAEIQRFISQRQTLFFVD